MKSIKIILTALVLCFGFMAMPAWAQSTDEEQKEKAKEAREEAMEDHAEDMDDHMEAKQEKADMKKTMDEVDLHQETDKAIEKAKKMKHDKSGLSDADYLYLEIYETVDKYPEVTYEHHGDHDKGVKVTGISDEEEKARFESNMKKLDVHKKQILNKQDEGGVYYLTETEPSPKQGYDQFYEVLHTNLEYPETAEAQGVEGTIVLKFKVDTEGNIHDVRAMEKLDNVGEDIAEDMKEEAIEAVKETSGDWKPAEVGGQAVSQWVVLPVQFRLKGPYYSDLF